MKKFLLLLVAVSLMGLALAQAPADTYVWQAFGEVVSLDPARAYDTASGEILENVYETLFTYDGANIDKFVPALATSYEVSEDGKTYTFTLREGVQFHSGNTFSCRDVEYSFERGMVTAHPEGAVSYLIGDQFLGTQIDGSDPEAYKAEVSFEMIDNAVECVDDYTVQLNLTKAEPALLAILAYTAFGIVDSQWAIENGMWDGTEATWEDWIGRDLTQEYMNDKVSGTGAYTVISQDSETTVAKRFDGYWGGAPALENVVYRYVDEQAANILALQQGDADRIVLGDQAGLVQLRGAPGVTVYENEDWNPTSVTTVFFNYDIDTSNNEDVGSGQLDGNGIPSDFFNDLHVRLGFASLFDQQGFIEQVYEGKGRALTVGMPPSFLGYDDSVPIRSLDLEAAEAHFRAAYDGQLWDTGFEFTALYNAGNTTRQTALEIIKENVEFLNPKFKMNVRALAWPDFLARTGEQKVPMFALGWGADYADPKNFIDTFYSNSGFYSARTSINFPDIQALIDDANRATDPAERAFYYSEIARKHYELAPLIALPTPAAYIAARSNLQGIYYNPMLSGEFLWKNLSKN